MKIDRLLGILTTLLQQGQVTAPALAEKFEVSRRTISRDIDALCQAGIPLVTRQGGGGGISIAEGYTLDRSVLTSDELAGILAAVKGIGSVTDARQTALTLQKLASQTAASVPQTDLIHIDLGSYHKDSLTEKIQILRQAVQQRSLVAFDYYYEKGHVRRSVEPYRLLYQWAGWYLLAYCADRSDWRLFKLNRLWNLVLLDEQFIPREVPPDRLSIESSAYTDHCRLVALFDPSARYQLVESYGPHCFTETDDGQLRMEIGYTNQAFIRTWLLGFGDKVRVLFPDELVEEIRRNAENMVRNYL